MQYIATLILIALAASWVVRGVWRALGKKEATGCGHGCGGCAPAPEAPVPGRIGLPQV